MKYFGNPWNIWLALVSNHGKLSPVCQVKFSDLAITFVSEVVAHCVSAPNDVFDC